MRTLSSRGAYLAVLALLIVAIYSGSLHAPFVLDDASAILDNPSIRHLWPIWEPLTPATFSTVGHRPLVNLSFALDYALHGTDPFGYHVFNLAVLLGSAFATFGLLNRIFALPACRSLRLGPVHAWIVAALWACHPVQTICVTYVSQRSESLMGLFYLLTLLSFVAGAGRALPPAPDKTNEVSHPRFSAHLCTIALCLAGMLCKETMISAPLAVLLIDGALISPDLLTALKRHRLLYLGLALTWLVPAWSTLSLDERGVEFGTSVDRIHYLFIESRALFTYLTVILWPFRLVFDYGPLSGAERITAVHWACFISLGLLLAGAIRAYRRNILIGLFGLLFFLLLAPTSTFIPIPYQPIAESRLYLPSLALLVAGAAALACVGDRRLLFLGVSLLPVGCLLTVERNARYQSALALWTDTVAKRPDNPRAHYNLAAAYAKAGQDPEAGREYQEALRLAPDFPAAHNGLGNIRSRARDWEAAGREYRAALRIDPNYSDASLNLARTLVEQGDPGSALEYFRKYLQLDPQDAAVRADLAAALAQAGRAPDALAEYETALMVDPANAEAHNNFANVLLREGQIDRALAHYAEAVRRRPSSAEFHYNHGNALLRTNALAAAQDEFERAIALNPEFVGAHNNLGLALLQQQRPADAVPHFAVALRLRPEAASLHQNLALALEGVGRWAEAISEDEAALRLQPAFPQAARHLEALRQKLDRR